MPTIEIFDTDIAELIDENIPEGALPDIVITRVTFGARPADVTQARPKTTTTYTTRGLKISPNKRQKDSAPTNSATGRTLAQAPAEASIFFLARTLENQEADFAPKPGDRIEIESETWFVVSVQDRDPAAATWTVGVAKSPP